MGIEESVISMESSIIIEKKTSPFIEIGIDFPKVILEALPSIIIENDSQIVIENKWVTIKGKQVNIGGRGGGAEGRQIPAMNNVTGKEKAKLEALSDMMKAKRDGDNPGALAAKKKAKAAGASYDETQSAWDSGGKDCIIESKHGKHSIWEEAPKEGKGDKKTTIVKAKPAEKPKEAPKPKPKEKPKEVPKEKPKAGDLDIDSTYTPEQLETLSTQNSVKMKANSIDILKKDRGLSDAEANVEYDKLVKHLDNDGEKVSVNMSYNAASKTIQNNKYENAWDRPEKVKEEMGADYMKYRGATEKDCGIKGKNVAYGGVSWGDKGGAPPYGNTWIELKPEAKKRSYGFLGDSFQIENKAQFESGVVTWKDMSHARANVYIRGSEGRGRLPLGQQRNGYVEVHIHGGIRNRDISRIHAPRQLTGFDGARRSFMTSAASSAGISIEEY